MEWLVWLAPVPVTGTAADVLPLQALTPVASVVALLAGAVPLLLAVRARWRGSKTGVELPHLRVLEGGRELRRRAA